MSLCLSDCIVHFAPVKTTFCWKLFRTDFFSKGILDVTIYERKTFTGQELSANYLPVEIAERHID